MGSGGSPHDEMRHTRDDLSLVYDATSGDAAVQTGSSLSSGFDIESLGSMLMSEWQQVLVELEIMVKVCILYTGRQELQSYQGLTLGLWDPCL